jgi:hypothetical protein
LPFIRTAFFSSGRTRLDLERRRPVRDGPITNHFDRHGETGVKRAVIHVQVMADGSHDSWMGRIIG